MLTFGFNRSISWTVFLITKNIYMMNKISNVDLDWIVNNPQVYNYNTRRRILPRGWFPLLPQVDI
jgi:hypothetical protein